MFGVIFLLLAIGIAVLAYRESETFKDANGITPWGVPSWVWALIGFFSLFICAVLLVIARRTTPPRPRVPAGPWYVQPSQQPSSAPPGWHPDPSGRHQFRYWDGHIWTAHVSSYGVTAHDPA